VTTKNGRRKVKDAPHVGHWDTDTTTAKKKKFPWDRKANYKLKNSTSRSGRLTAQARRVEGQVKLHAV